MNDWRDCIISVIDLRGIRDMAKEESSRATRTMQEFHRVVAGEVSTLLCHEHVYVWNDSVAMVALTGGPLSDCAPIMEEVLSVMKKIDPVCPCYAISVKGRAFPPPTPSSPDRSKKFTFLSISSYAFSNCDKIQKDKRFRGRKWYVDSRIVRQVGDAVSGKIHSITMLPKYYRRNIHMYSRSLWEG